jgi:exodeoxyribonuclease V
MVFLENGVGYRGHYPEPGEQVCCLLNAAEYNVFNGGTYTTLAYYPRRGCIVLDVDGEEVEIEDVAFRPGPDVDLDNYTTAFDYGYCVTVHKSQGSEYNNVVLIDEMERWRRST